MKEQTVRIAFGASEITVRNLDGEADVETFLSGCDWGHISLGEDSQGRQVLSGITIHPRGLVSTFGILVRSETHGLAPVLLLREDIGQIWIGYNRTVAGIAVDDRKLCFALELESLFHRFLRHDNNTIVLLETAAASIDDAGELIWRHSTDLIEDWSLRGDQLRLTFWDDEPVTIALASGALTSDGT